MKKIIWIIVVLLMSTTIALAQMTCLPLETALSDALTNCDDADIGTLCYGSGDISLEVSADEISFESPSDTVNLSDILSFQTENEDETIATAMIALNREDVALRMIAYGHTEIENTAPRNTISVYALRGVNLRQEPSVDASVIGSLVQGRDYTAVGRLADNSWIRVLLEDGRLGWASAQYFSTRDGFTQLDAVTPSTPPYLPMQSLTLLTEDCSGLIIIAPEVEDETIIFGINGAQIEGVGIVHIHTQHEELIIEILEGEAIVNTFGFELPLSAGELTRIPLNDDHMIISIGSDAEEVAEPILSDEGLELLRYNP